MGPNTTYKVDKILKGRLDSIPSLLPSVKVHIIGGKVSLRCKGKTLLVVVKKLLKTKCLMTSPSNAQCFALLPRVNFSVNNLNLYKGSTLTH